MHLTCVSPTLSSGGSERALVNLTNYWVTKGWTITIVSLDSRDTQPFYSINPDVQVIPLGVDSKSFGVVSALWNNVNRLHQLRQSIIRRMPDVVISFIHRTNVITILATRGLNVPVIVTEQNDPWFRTPGVGWSKLREWSYPQADRLVVLGESMVSYFSPQVQQICRVIPNPVVIDPVPPLGNQKFSRNGRHTLIAMGSLHPQKGFDMLLHAFARVAPYHPTWTLEIWGEGKMRSQLESMRDILGLAERVQMPGRTREPFEKFRQADLFVFSSHYEGFGVALAEAMACGLPAISFDCPTGPGIIIRDEIDGLLVAPEDVEGLAQALDRLMGNTDERQRMAACASQVLNRFGVELIAGKWEQVIREVAR